MADFTRMGGGVLMIAGLLALGGCGKKGPLYLPDSNGDVVEAGPPSESGGSSSSPPSVDSPPAPPNPAPEVTEPEDPAPEKKKEEKKEKEKEGGTPPQR